MEKYEWLSVINNPELRESAYNAGRRAVKIATGSTSNACAATCSERLRQAGLLSRVYLNTGGLRKALVDWLITDDWRDIKPGYIVFTADKNYNGMPDHVMVAITAPNESGHCLVIDNQHGGKPYTRNVKTIDSAMYLPDSEMLDSNAKKTAFQGFRMLYSINKQLSQQTRAMLNDLRKQPEFEHIGVDR